MTEGPWSFEQALEKCRSAAAAQKAVERDLREAFKDFAEAEERYRKALAEAILHEAHDNGVAWTATADIARGDKHVAKLRRDRDVAEGLKEAMLQAAWRRAADRKDAQRFADWSQRRELAEFHGEPTPQELRNVRTQVPHQ